MADLFSTFAKGITAPGSSASAVTPHDTNELTQIPRALYVGGAGNVAVILKDDTAAVTFVGVAAGTVLPIRARIVKATATTATNILAIW